jgi:phage terminase large subunit GpA-like protein
VKRRPRNEQLDNRNYALHAALGLGLDRWPQERWVKLEAALQPAKDLFASDMLSARHPDASANSDPKPLPLQTSPQRHNAAEDLLFDPIAL